MVLTTLRENLNGEWTTHHRVHSPIHASIHFTPFLKCALTGQPYVNNPQTFCVLSGRFFKGSQHTTGIFPVPYLVAKNC